MQARRGCRGERAADPNGPNDIGRGLRGGEPSTADSDETTGGEVCVNGGSKAAGVQELGEGQTHRRFVARAWLVRCRTSIASRDRDLAEIPRTRFGGHWLNSADLTRW